jgi:hypothetical protein
MAFKGTTMAVNPSLATFKSFMRTKFCASSMLSAREAWCYRLCTWLVLMMNPKLSTTFRTRTVACYRLRKKWKRRTSSKRSKMKASSQLTLKNARQVCHLEMRLPRMSRMEVGRTMPKSKAASKSVSFYPTQARSRSLIVFRQWIQV